MVEKGGRVPVWLLALAAGFLVAVALVVLAVVGGRSLPSSNGPPIEELAVEATVFRPGVIELTVRNTGPDPVRVSQVFVNDSFVDLTGGEDPIGRLQSATLRLDYQWQEGQPYVVSLLTSTGAVVEHEISVAVDTPSPGGVVGLMALLGTYVGIIPVALGMFLLPVLRRVGRTAIQVLLAVTVGLLGFLAVDGGLEALSLAAETGGAFGGPVLVVLGAVLAYLALAAVDGVLRARRRRVGAGHTAARDRQGVPALAAGADAAEPDSASRSDLASTDDLRGRSGLRLAVLIAVGIGLHNLGEGLAVGSAYAVGELALGTFLVVGFALHNTTEGIAIVTPLADSRPSFLQLGGLGLLAGAPAILGAMLGATVDNRELSAFLIGVGVGAIVQVILAVAPILRARSGQLLTPVTIGGIVAGVLIMYLTGLLVAA